jgi:aryl-alcohol dehydrogenase-like predicted oxidoreductase
MGMSRLLGRSGVEVSEIACGAIGGPFTMDGWPDGSGEADDESIAALRRTLELVITFFDTSHVGF